MLPFTQKQRYTVDDLVQIMQILRSEKGCPWDKQQDHKSIRNNFIEETYEVIEAIDTDDIGLLREELGDVLLQVTFHSQIEAENENFNFNDVANDICQKLIVRHPHIFGNVIANTTEQVLDNWENIKRAQKGQATVTTAVKAVPRQLPSLMRAAKVQSRAAKSGFDYPDLTYALTDLKSELAELEQAIACHDSANIKEELGDLLFACTNVGRFVKNDCEEALTFATDKFIDRFELVEQLASDLEIDMKNADIELLNRLWDEAKRQTRASDADHS